MHKLHFVDEPVVPERLRISKTQSQPESIKIRLSSLGQTFREHTAEGSRDLVIRVIKRVTIVMDTYSTN